MFIVESTDPYSLRPELTDERHECATPIEAGQRVEELSPLYCDEVAELLSEGQPVTWAGEETGRVVEAWQVERAEV